MDEAGSIVSTTLADHRLADVASCDLPRTCAGTPRSSSRELGEASHAAIRALHRSQGNTHTVGTALAAPSVPLEVG